ncbi:hypothetical protein G7046_g7036 [Stylonectria norvegica]|nr:hypothetical protein G7046_g7036 [Stylonectria norvegica]
MVQEVIGGPQATKLHPLFSKGSLAQLPDPITNHVLPSASKDPVHDAPKIDSESGDGSRKRRKTDPTVSQSSPGPKRQRRKKGDKGEATPVCVPNATPVSSFSDALQHPRISGNFPTPPLSDTSRSVTSNQPARSTAKMDSDSFATQLIKTVSKTPSKPKKVLKFNPTTGTLGSPPKPKQKHPTSRLVSIKYGQDETTRREIGSKITRILEGTLIISTSPSEQPKPRNTRKLKGITLNQADVSKPAHPFFTGKATKTPANEVKEASSVEEKSPLVRMSLFMSTPVSPKKTRSQFTSDKLPQFGVKSGAAKFPGALHPLWPAQGMGHVRGYDSPVPEKDSILQEQVPKKSKGSVVAILSHESLLGQFEAFMDLDKIRDTLPQDEDEFTPAPPELRIPKRHFESGRELQKRIRSQLRTYRPQNDAHSCHSQDDLPDKQSKKTHPTIKKYYDALETSLSAFDRSTCENLDWIHKYAPTEASHVLQAGREATLLKEWLQTLKVQSVDSGGADFGAAKGKAKPDSAVRKRRKKNKLDGFIVNSDHEEDEMDEVSENEDDWAPSGSGQLKKTVIRCGDTATKGTKDQGRFTNAVVLSGPHGSGKTAAVYAVAKELGFEVFEINPGSRRSGKDILEKVGDMTRNHLVQHHRVETAAEEDVEDEVSRDLKSGKQGTMMTFFKPKATPVLKKAIKPDVQTPIEKPEAKQLELGKGGSMRTQKQSLILLEEVDVLFDEDKQFWATLITMIAQSKRPFIMTCNDESLVPLQTLSLHGIFRFSPPPTNLAVDFCLLVAANEGHALRRSAVEALYTCRDNDLRATLTELNYWCQIGVGDRRGGSDWFYLRWPKGADLDENGNVVRVVSEDTYRRGMGWFGRDLIASHPDPLKVEEEAMRQCRDSWGLDLGDWNNSIDLEAWADEVSSVALDSKRTFISLAAYDDFCGTMSELDIYSGGAFGTRYHELLDPTVPDFATKIKDDFTIGQRLLQADLQVPFCSPNVDISMTLESLARSELRQATSALGASGARSMLDPISERNAVSVLDSSFQSSTTQLSRLDLAVAFDPIAVSEKATPSSHLDPSVFDRNLQLIVLDVAPWVRGIVEYDHRLMLERAKLSSLLSEGGKRKRMRNTRSAYSALEGGQRSTTRRERYFGGSLTTDFVRRTGGEQWQDAIPVAAMPADDMVSVPSSPPSECSSTV